MSADLFTVELAAAGFTAIDYDGRHGYQGPAVTVEHAASLQDVIRATSVRLQWDQVGRDGLVIYPACDTDGGPVPVLPPSVPEPPVVWQFTFDATADQRKGPPYVAHISCDRAEPGTIKRTFFPFLRARARNTVSLRGTYDVPAGTLVEIREEASWKNDWRYWAIVTTDGRLMRLCYPDHNADGKLDVVEFLTGMIDIDTLFSRRCPEEIAHGVGVP